MSDGAGDSAAIQPFDQDGAPAEDSGALRLEPLPSATLAFGRIAAMRHRRAAVFLDYDGTLAPLAVLPDLAILDEEMRRTVVALKDCAEVTVVSGRDLDDLIERVAIEGIAYAGSHGFEAQYANGARAVLGDGVNYREALDHVTVELMRQFVDTPGVLIENKRFATAVHYRLSPPELELPIGASVLAIVNAVEGLRMALGKKVFEVRPATHWNKGTFVELLLHHGNGSESSVIPRHAIYLGDDVTDEDGFRAVHDDGIGIVVGERSGLVDTSARYQLTDVAQVRVWLDELCRVLRAFPSEPAASP